MGAVLPSPCPGAGRHSSGACAPLPDGERRNRWNMPGPRYGSRAAWLAGTHASGLDRSAAMPRSAGGGLHLIFGGGADSFELGLEPNR